jgi:XTP/dITP diphosphohydrolase
MPLLFATNNKNKLNEIRSALGDSFLIQSLEEANIHEDIPEPWHTIEENSLHKAKYIFEKYNIDCFGEDTGLIVPALNGAPGVFSARYAGLPPNDNNNIDKLINELQAHSDRSAYFKTVITICQNGEYNQFEGICEGEIINERKGENGFGYDPIFIPKGSTLCFAEMNKEDKNKFSHRRKAMDKLITYLQ